MRKAMEKHLCPSNVIKEKHENVGKIEINGMIYCPQFANFEISVK